MIYYPPTFQVFNFVAPIAINDPPVDPAHQRSLSGPYSLGEAPTPGQRQGEAIQKSIYTPS